MSKRQAVQQPNCPVARTVDLIGERWTLLLVRDAFDGVRRFTDFQRGLGVARSVLADRLHLLVEAGIFEVQPSSDGSAYMEYVLTARGKELFPIVVALRQWGELQLFEPDEPRSALVETATGDALALMRPVTRRGRIVSPEETTVRKVSSPTDFIQPKAS